MMTLSRILRNTPPIFLRLGLTQAGTKPAVCFRWLRVDIITPTSVLVV